MQFKVKKKKNFIFHILYIIVAPLTLPCLHLWSEKDNNKH